MSDFPYTLNTANLTRFLSHIQSASVPEKLNQQYLMKSGFRSSNDRNAISILKFIGFVDNSGKPTKSWMDYRNTSKAKEVMANALRKSYADLFSMFPEANKRDNEALRNYFSAHVKAGDRVLAATVTTFKTLCSLSDFETLTEIPGEIEKPLIEMPEGKVSQGKKSIGIHTVNINIQLQLPATEDASVYEKLFDALKKTFNI